MSPSSSHPLHQCTWCSNPLLYEGTKPIPGKVWHLNFFGPLGASSNSNLFLLLRAVPFFSPTRAICVAPYRTTPTGSVVVVSGVGKFSASAASLSLNSLWYVRKEQTPYPLSLKNEPILFWKRPGDIVVDFGSNLEMLPRGGDRPAGTTAREDTHSSWFILIIIGIIFSWLMHVWFVKFKLGRYVHKCGTPFEGGTDGSQERHQHRDELMSLMYETSWEQEMPPISFR